MGSMSISHWLIVAIVVLVLFGRGRISETMADFGKGISSFRRGMSEDDQSGQRADEPVPNPRLDQQIERP
ncbi:twin-arginine translocase TatA/TatE family subunit [Novosphingobium sp.]|uniref:twin-arginine translocase TatA/TatE family subunit n=1 Tax=Novosphingobium sp. TaxID=1874826 RepID=UPI001DE20EC7|nr:twin-arginine translocase TatA/TatE family subunit [Novosphingobium sp.]MBX9665587.1 twin-arginine translocase TatA/TatE family subunit [Novosphingobium sp.]